MQVPENFFDAARRRSAALNRIMVDIAHSNLCFGFELARAKTVFDVLKLQAEYWQKLFNAFQGSELRNWFVRSGEPGWSPVNQNETATGEHVHSQMELKIASSSVMGTAADKPEQGSEQSPKRSSATHVSAVKKNAEKSRSAPKDHHPSSRETNTGDKAVQLAAKAPKQPSRQSPKRSAATRAPAIKRKAERSRSTPKDRRPPSRKSHAGRTKTTCETEHGFAEPSD